MTFSIEQSPEIWHRGDFPLLCMWRRLRRIVEVGVDRGDYARIFLDRSWNLEFYLGVDSYLKYGEMKWNREADHIMAATKMEPHGHVAKLARCSSADMAATIKRMAGVNQMYGDKIDFVYIDADHSYEGVRQDIALWWPLVSDRGILAGHDWSMTTGDHAGVQRAVVEFAKENDLTVYHTYLDDPQSWFIYKTARPDDYRREP